jgi:predicted nucleic acid-binding protein
MAAASDSRETNCMNAVDTNVFVYWLDADEPIKQSKARELLKNLTRTSTDTVLLWQVAGETLSCLRRWESAGRISRDDVAVHFANVIAMFELRIPSPSLFTVSFDLQSRFSLSHWDSMLLAGCKEAGVDLLYSEDLDAATNYDGVKIVNPFT